MLVLIGPFGVMMERENVKYLEGWQGVNLIHEVGQLKESCSTAEARYAIKR
jgi:hypothetical protein